MRINLFDNAKDAFRFLRFVVRRWNEDRCPQIAGALAFTTLLALVPLFAIAVSLLARSHYFGDLSEQIRIFLTQSLLPEVAGRIVKTYLGELTANAGRLTTFGLLFLLGTSVVLMLTVDRSLNIIWRSHGKRPFWISVPAYLLLLVVGPVLIGVSVSITTYLMSLPSLWKGAAAPAHSLMLRGLPFLVGTATFFLMYRMVPHRKMPWRHALAGAIVAGVLFESLKHGFGIYVANARMYSVVYGTFAAIPFFLLWVYACWLIVLLGAELAAALEEWAPQPQARSEASGRGDVE